MWVLRYRFDNAFLVYCQWHYDVNHKVLTANGGVGWGGIGLGWERENTYVHNAGVGAVVDAQVLKLGDMH